MTRVLLLNELKQIIPQVKELEGINFGNDLKYFLTELIKQVELSGEWVFVQYVANPSLFIVRKKDYLTEIPQQVYDTVENMVNVALSNNPITLTNSANEIKKVLVKKQPLKTTEKVTLTPSKDSKLFTENKLPW